MPHKPASARKTPPREPAYGPPQGRATVVPLFPDAGGAPWRRTPEAPKGAFGPRRPVIVGNPRAEAYILRNHAVRWYKDIARDLKCSPSTVYMFLRNRGLNTRNPAQEVRLGIIRRLTHAQLGQIAALLDGEGVVSALFERDGTLSWRLLVCNTSLAMMDDLSRWGFSAHVSRRAKTAREHRGDMYTAVLERGELVDAMLRRVLPYMRVKRTHALLLLHVIALRSRLPHRRAKRADAAVTGLIRQHVETLNYLNDRSRTRERQNPVVQRRMAELARQLERDLPASPPFTLGGRVQTPWEGPLLRRGREWVGVGD